MLYKTAVRLTERFAKLDKSLQWLQLTGIDWFGIKFDEYSVGRIKGCNLLGYIACPLILLEGRNLFKSPFGNLDFIYKAGLGSPAFLCTYE